MSGPKESIWFNIAAAALLVFMAVMAGSAALRESAVIDEYAHIAAGVTYLQKLDLRFNEEHPPLSKVIAAAPLVVRGVRADYSGPQWTLAERFFPAFAMQWLFGEMVLTRWNDPQTVLAWVRAPMLLLTLVLGWLVYVQARRLGGPWGGLLSLSLYVSMPAFLAFGPLVLNDIAVTLFALWFVQALASLWQNPNRRNAVLLALALAGALLSKFSAGLLLLCIPALAMSGRWRPLPEQPRDKLERSAWRRLRWRKAGFAMLVSAGVVYAVYFVLSLGQSTAAVDKLGSGVYTEPLRRLVLPAWLFIRGLLMMLVMSSRPTFILGHAYPHGVWFYFPVLLLLKTPLGFLSLLAAGLTLAIVRRRETPVVAKTEWMFRRALWVTFGVFTFALLLSRLNLSIRHFSIPLVLLIVMLAPLPRMASNVWTRGLVDALALSSLATAVWVWPNYIPYVNAFGMGRPAYELMNDSNVDWNQGLYEVKKFAAAHRMSAIKVDYYGLSDPAPFAPGAEIWDCQAPAESDAGTWVVVSANMILDMHNCAWMIRYPHLALAGGSMFAIHLPERIPPAGDPGGPPPVSARRNFMGAPFDPRTMVVDLVNHPEKIAKTMADAEAQMKAAMQKGTQKPK